MRIFFPAEYLSRISWQIFGNSVTICTCRPLASKTMDPRPIGLQAQPCTRRKHQTFLWQYGGIVAMVGKTKGYRSFISGFVLSFPTWHCKLRKPRCKCIYICSICIWNKNWGKIPMYHHHPKKSLVLTVSFSSVQGRSRMIQYVSIYVLCNDWFRPLAALACLCLISWQCPILPVARQRSFVLPNVLMHWICKTRADHAGQTMKSNEITWCFWNEFSSEITSYSHYVMTCHTALCICVLQWLSWTDSLHGHAWSLCAFGCGCALWRGLSTL